MSHQSSNFIAHNAWRHRSQADHGCATRRWLEYCKEKGKDKFNLTIVNILNFLEYCFFEKKATYVMLTKLNTFASVSHKLAGFPFNEGEKLRLDKFMTACFNAVPPIPRQNPGTWDVNIILDYFVDLGENKTLTVNQLAGKSLILILLSTMCHSGKLLYFKITNMTVVRGGLEFLL